MQLTWLGKFNNSFPWLFGLMAGGMVIVGTATYLMVETPKANSNLDEFTVPVEKKDLRVEIEANGTVEPVQSVNISPKTPGRLTKLLVDQGYPVKQGQKLAIMENSEIQAQGMQAQANLKQAIATFKEAEIRIPEEIRQGKARLAQAQARLQEAKQRIPRQVDQARAQLRAAEARLKLAQDRLKRNQYLVEEGAVAQDQFDEALNEYLSAEANLLESLQYLEQVKNTQSPELLNLEAAVGEAQIALEQRQKTSQVELAQLAATAEAAKAQLDEVKIQFQDTFILAPFDGVVTQKYATEGAFVTPTTSASSTASATSSSIIALARGLEVVAEVPEIDLGRLQPGQPVKIVPEAYPEQVFPGQVRRIAPEAIVEENVTSFEVTIALLDGYDKLRSKMNVDVTFLGEPISNALVVPTVAIVTQEGQTGVMVPDFNNKPKFKPVTIGMTLDDQTQILRGLMPGEKIFVELPENLEK